MSVGFSVKRPRPSEVVLDRGAFDFDVKIEIEGVVKSGEITLVPKDGALYSFGGGREHQWCCPVIVRAVEPLSEPTKAKLLAAVEAEARRIAGKV